MFHVTPSGKERKYEFTVLCHIHGTNWKMRELTLTLCKTPTLQPHPCHWGTLYVCGASSVTPGERKNSQSFNTPQWKTKNISSTEMNFNIVPWGTSPIQSWCPCEGRENRMNIVSAVPLWGKGKIDSFQYWDEPNSTLQKTSTFIVKLNFLLLHVRVTPMFHVSVFSTDNLINCQSYACLKVMLSFHQLKQSEKTDHVIQWFKNWLCSCEIHHVSLTCNYFPSCLLYCFMVLTQVWKTKSQYSVSVACSCT